MYTVLEDSLLAAGEIAHQSFSLANDARLLTTMILALICGQVSRYRVVHG
jgi:hypothetical protein